ncbi:unnamed protein product, partial [Cladocopium goreaui]
MARDPAQDQDVEIQVNVETASESRPIARDLKMMILKELLHQNGRHRAAFGPLLMNKAQIISVADLDRTCFPERSPLQCMIWHGDTEIRARLAIRNRHGLAFVIVINRVFVPPSQDPWEDEFEDAVFFQLGHQVISQKEGHVIGLIAGNPSLPLPTYVEILGPVTDHSLCQELRHWGHHGPAFLFGEHDKAVVFAPSFFDSDEGYHYILHNEDTTDENGAFLHSSPIPLSSLEIMQFLYKLDYWRAVVLKFECLNRNLFRIAFKNQCVQVQPSTLKSRPNTPWPELQPHGASGDGYYVMDQNAPTAQKPDHFIDFGLGDADFMNLFSSHHHVLSRDCTGMELPQVCQDVLGMCDDSIDFKDFDRLVIYCDGSSVNTHKYKSPLQAEEEGGGDTWAFLVLGERYDPPGLQCLGWTAQPTHYHHESPFHLGSDRVGADLAEKEALAWSALWRLSLNSKIPTCFRSDSQTSLGQAQGTLGCHANAELFAFLRGVFQALESFLPGEQLHLSHVAGHAGEGLWVPPPELPGALENATVPDEALPQMHDQVSFNISFCTANVNSLHRAPDGHAGKVQYLRRQFKQLCLIFLGLQETRSPEFSSCVDGVLRLAGGCSGHQQGVELWVNLSQPYAHVGGAPVYFHREDFRVVVKSSRILLVRGDSAYWSGWILVGYAPHSGLSLDVKEAFWNDLKAAVAPCGPGDHIFALLDANASPGEYDGVCVFREGLASSSSTRFLRDFLETHELCLPCTSDVHVGELTSWVSPDGQRDHCIDFVAIPRTLQRRCTISQAVPELDLGHGDWDHIAMCVELSWEETHLRRKAQQAFTLPFDPSSIDKDKVKLILQDYQPMDWCADVESHVQQFNQHVLEGLSSHCPRDRDRPKKHYIDPKTWELRRMKLKLKKKLQGLRIRSRDENKIVFFKAWKNVLQLSSEPLEAERVWTYANSLLCHGLRLAADLRRTAMQLKMLLKNAKKNEIKEVFETMDPRASASHILHSIKPILGPTNLKKIKSGTLPFLKKSNGEPCTLPNEALEEFLGHKGGFLQPLWKGKGPIDDPASFRSILISSHIGKALHRTLRESQCSIFETFLQTEQIGGRKKVPVNLGVHMCRAFMRAHKAAGDSVGMIYLDLKEAFYRIVRQLATGGNASDALLAKVCARFGLPEGVLHDLHCHLSQPAALLDAGLPQHARNAVQALHEDTFFRVKGQRDCCRTELGTRPGDCYADVIFSYIWCRILKLLQGELQRLDIGEEICTDEGIHVCADRALPAGVPRPFLGPTWMDDTCICVSSCTAIGVESKTIHAAGLLLQFCEQHALTPNLQKGKTEVLFAFQGTGSRSLKKKYFGPQSDQCMHILAEHGLKKIQVVSKYAHLGCMMHHKSDNRHEARKRIAIAQQTFTQHQRYLLRNPQLSLKRRKYMHVWPAKSDFDRREVLVRTISKDIIKFLLSGEGPVLPTGRMIDLSPYDLELIEAIYLNIVENESETSSEDVVRFVIENHVISWTRCRDTLKQMLAELTSDDIEILAEHRRDLRDVLERLQQPDAWTFLQDTVRAKSGALQSVEHYEAVFEQHLHDHHDPIWSIPRPMGRERFIIHAFSGRRRPGDVQFFLDGLQAQPDGTSIFTISLDVIIDEEFGDVSRESVRDFWLRGIRERAVIGMLAGPPCETWSQARGKSLSSSSNLLHRKAPRIIRDRTCLWGKAALALRELEQLHLGNLLLLFTIEMLIHLAVQGGVGAMEHPAPPNDEALASVWHLFIIRYLCAWPEFLRIELAQGLWGATSPKPTSLLLLNLPKMPQVLRSWQVTKCLPGAKSIGQNEDGSWRTSQLKEYPPALCAGLAQGLFEAINDHKVDSALTMDGNFRAQA